MGILVSAGEFRPQSFLPIDSLPLSLSLVTLLSSGFARFVILDSLALSLSLSVAALSLVTSLL